ncbi:extracellular solute-binding protein [Ruania alkalisoli]|uniref:Extracellular solute-binding protein n=1 Tax=Ruania alkalisoli TaxID=2779775 RepID=A0A7M1SV25_9MICO|nr:extracellular solute-binding protein [Ruania alkalisoli]QOR71436.1 extracellular solute-binding protein [Ruania alkalisoli]
MTRQQLRRRGRLLGVGATVAALLATAACGGPDTPGGGTEGGGVGSEGPVTVWTDSGVDAQLVEQYLSDWAEENGVDLTVEHQVGNEYQQTIQLALQTGNGPDVFAGNRTNVLIAAGYVMPLDDFVTDDIREAYGDLLDPPQTYMSGGSLYTLPSSITTTRLAYNRDIFTAAGLDPDAPPETLGEMREACEAIVAAGDASCVGVPLNWNGFATWYVDRMAASSDDDLTVQGAFRLSEQQYDFSVYEPVIEFFREAVAQGWAYPGASSVANDIIRTEFAAGNIGMVMSASWDVGELNEVLNTEIGWSASNIPVPDGAEFVQNLGSSGGGWAINAATEAPETAGAIVMALASPEVAEMNAAEFATMPIRPDVEMPDRDDQLLDYAPTDTDNPTLNSPVAGLAIQGETYRDVLTALVLGDEEIAPALQELTDRYNAALDEAVEDGSVNLADYAGS